MRLTLELDDRVLAAARARAAAEGISTGKAVSAYALAGLEGSASGPRPAGRHRLPVLFDGPDGHVVTSELVAAALDDQ
jgi:hypothetical protein